MRTVFLTCAAWSCLVLVAAARDIFVNNIDGDDRSDGQQSRGVVGISGPVHTITKALRLAVAGDRIVVANTPLAYRETLSLSGEKHSGSLISAFVIEGNGATLDGSAPVRSQAWTHHDGDVFCFRPERLAYQQLFLADRPAVRHPTTPRDVTLPALEPLEWCLSAGRIYFRVQTGQLPDAYQPAYCQLQTGITLYHVHDVVIRNFTIQGFQSDGVAASDGVRSARLDALACRANGRSGIAVSGASRVELNGCVLADNGEGQLRCEGFAQTRVYQSELIANTSGALLLRGGRVTIDGEPATGHER
jgi:hypothetical protein